MSQSNTVITSQFINSMASIVAMDKTANSINLAIDANSSSITEQELISVYENAINGLMSTKQALLSEKKPADMLVHNTLKQAFKRHSMAVLQQALLLKYDRPQAAKLLTFSSINKDGVSFTDKPTQKKLNSFTTFDCVKDKIIVLGSPKFDKIMGQYFINISIASVDIQQLVYDYTNHLSSLSDDIPVLTSDASTTPMIQPATSSESVNDQVKDLVLQVAELELKNDDTNRDLNNAVQVNSDNDAEFTKLLEQYKKLEKTLITRDTTIKTLRGKLKVQKASQQKAVKAA